MDAKDDSLLRLLSTLNMLVVLMAIAIIHIKVRKVNASSIKTRFTLKYLSGLIILQKEMSKLYLKLLSSLVL